MFTYLKSAYKSLAGESFRRYFRVLNLKIIRNTKLLNILEAFGVIVCKDYIVVSNTESEKKNFDSVKEIIVYEDFKTTTIPSAGCIEDQRMETFDSPKIDTETFLLDSKAPSFSFNGNHLLDSDLNIIGGYKLKFEMLPAFHKFLAKPSYFQGTIAYLSDPKPLNYYHWMCGVLPLMRVYKKCLSLKDIDFYYLGNVSISNFHRESLKRAGIEEKQLICRACRGERMITAIDSRFVDLNDPISREAYEFTRSLFSDVIDKTSWGKRIYVQRGNVARRRLLNETQVIERLSTYGFEPISMDNKTIEEQAQLFSQAEAVIAPHGAALTNLLFVKPHTQVIELLPHGYMNNCFYVLANYSEANYFYLRGEPMSHDNSVKANELDIRIDIEKLEHILSVSLSNLN